MGAPIAVVLRDREAIFLILQLLEKADCRYTLVVETSKRARQLIDGVPPLIDAKDKENMPLSVAIDEVNRGLITYERSPEIDVK